MKTQNCTTSPIKEGKFHYHYEGLFRLHDPKLREIDPVLFINGSLQEMDSWKYFSDHFKQKTLVVLADIPGTGNAENVSPETPLEYQAQYLLRLLKHLNINRVNIIAASYGTPIALKLLQFDEKIVSHIALVGTMKSIPTEAQQRIRKVIELLEANNITEFLVFLRETLMALDKSNKIINFTRVSRIFDHFVRLSPHKRQQFIINSKRLLNFEGFSFPKKISSPALVFTGEYDPFTKPELCWEIAKEFSNCLYTTIKNADHMVHLETFETCLALFNNFFYEKNLEDVPGINAIIRLQAGEAVEREKAHA